MKPTDVPPTATIKFFGAGMAACVADLLTFPLDTAKVRLQVRIPWHLFYSQLGDSLDPRWLTPTCFIFFQIQGEAKPAEGASGVKYRGVFGTITTMVRMEGPRSLYSGLVAGLQRQMSFASVRIGLYDSMKQFYTHGSESEERIRL